jgi:bifunctional UDP-N-acetylglucosamine pyrophosphorylase / glucosamine-1-phosphate N-acetyltransferase
LQVRRADTIRGVPTTAVIMAAGQGTRMKSATPKVLHPVCGLPMVLWPVRAALAAGADRVVVVGGPDRALEPVLPEGVQLAVQAEARGTGDAVRAAAPLLDPADTVLVLNGDLPLITAEAIGAFAAAHGQGGAPATMATMILEDPGDYGRVVRGPDGSVERVVEAKGAGDATAAELAIREVNTGLYAFDGAPLLDVLEHLRADNAQGEYYLPEVLAILRAGGHPIGAHVVDDPAITHGVNDRADLAAVSGLAQARIQAAHMAAGVTIVNPAATVIEADVALGADTVLEPGTYLRGATAAGSGCTLGPNTTLIDCQLGDGVTAINVHGVEARAGDGASIGPFAYLRPGTVLGDGVKVGTFVEIKNSVIGAGTKVPHLSYIGDADVGEQSNLGAGTITANYDGRHKHRTTIGSRVHGGVHVSLVAPVALGDDAWTAAGSVIVSDVPDEALGVARERQRNIDGYDRRGRD